jgi:RNA polymerase sigma factor (sigma-70 family)
VPDRNTPGDEPADVDAVVRRALAARTSDPHLVDDLAQETLLRLASSDRDLTPDEERAYAVVTARNLLASHFRRQSVQRRHIHRLVEHGGAVDPEQHSIDNEETAALATALDRLDPGERDLLVRHEVTGTDLATLAGESDLTRGAIAMRLARARANLRLEFLLVFRRLSLPTADCRPVLLALASADRRRQAQLDAAGHVETCPTCAALIGPMTDRDRRVAAWLLVPLGDAARRIRRALRSWWARVATVATLLGVVGGLILLTNPQGEADDRATGARDATATTGGVAEPTPGPTTTVAITTASTAPPPTVAPTTVAAAAPASAAPAPTAASSAPVAVTPAPTVRAADEAPACPPPAPLSELDLPAADGCPFTVSLVTVVAVSSGTTLAATAGARSVTIHLIGAGGLPLAVVPGVRISIAGTVDDAPGPDQLAVTVAVGDVALAN